MAAALLSQEEYNFLIFAERILSELLNNDALFPSRVASFISPAEEIVS